MFSIRFPRSLAILQCLLFQSDYEKLAKQCEDFAVDLLDQVRGSKELEILLNYNATPANYLGDGEEFKMNLDRLKLAIKYKQKRVRQ